MSDFNPYEAPRAVISPGRSLASDDSGVWQDGKLLVMTKDAELPDRCVKCNQPADGQRLKRNLSWHPPGWYILVAISPLLYVIAALIVRKTAKIEVGLCADHRSQRQKAIAVGWIVSLAGIGIMIGIPATFPDSGGLGVAVGAIILLTGILYGVIRSQVTPPKKIDKQFVWLSQVSPDYLIQLPTWGR